MEDETAYTLALWRVKEGREGEFLEAWKSRTPSQPDGVPGRVLGPATLPVACYVGRAADVLDLREVAPGVGPRTVEVGEAVFLR
jgi:hypothetical protein